MTNYMQQVARMLGVELGEEFQIQTPNKQLDGVLYRLNEDGLEFFIHNDWSSAERTLSEILRGNCSIVQKPYIPRKDDWYWYCDKSGGARNTTNAGSTLDRYLIKSGNCYRTKAEAEATADRWKAWFESDERMDVFHEA